MVDDTGRLGKNRTWLPSLGALEMHVRCVRMASSTNAGLITYSLAVLGMRVFRKDIQRSGTRNQAKNM